MLLHCLYAMNILIALNLYVFMIVCSIPYEHLRTALEILMYKLNASIYTCTCMYHTVSNCMTIIS